MTPLILTELMSDYKTQTAGQMTLSEDVLEHPRIHPDKKITMDKLPDDCPSVKDERPTTAISAIFNMLKKESLRSLSIEKMNEIAAGRLHELWVACGLSNINAGKFLAGLEVWKEEASRPVKMPTAYIRKAKMAMT